MSPQLSARCLLAVLAAMLLASAVGLLAMEPVALAMPAAERGLGPSILVPLLALVAAIAGWYRSAGLTQRDRQLAWRAFFGAAVVGASLCVLGSLVPSPRVWWLSRIAIGSAGAIAGLIFLAERLGPRWIAPRALALGLLAGPIAALVGLAAQAVHGQPDERLLIWLECAPLLLLPLGVWGLPSRGVRDADWLATLAFFAAAKFFEVLDHRIGAALAIDGHLLSEVGLALSVAWLAGAIGRQSRAFVATEAASGPVVPTLADVPAGDPSAASRLSGASASARETSANTAA